MSIKNIKLIFVLVFSINTRGSLFAHDQPVHFAITLNAAAAAQANFIGCLGFINTTSNDVSLFKVTNAMVWGSWDEDYRDWPGDFGGKRSLNRKANRCAESRLHLR